MPARWNSPAFLLNVLSGAGAASAVVTVFVMKMCSASQYSVGFPFGQFLFASAMTASPYLFMIVLSEVFSRRPAALGVVLPGSIVVAILGAAAHLSTLVGLIQSSGQSSHMGGAGLETALVPLLQWPLLVITALAAKIGADRAQPNLNADSDVIHPDKQPLPNPDAPSESK